MSSFSGRGLHGQLVRELGRRIVGAELPPGSTIDPERIASEFEVSRTVVREALKVLTAKGLVGARPRFGTYVTERAHWQLLDAEVMQWRTADEPDARLVTELGEVRLAIEPAAARMAAERRTADDLERIRAAYERMDLAYRGDEPARPDPADADLEFHRAILAASRNELLEQFEVVLAPAIRARDRLAHRHLTTLDFLDGHRSVYEAIAAADPGKAFARMQALMQFSAEDSVAALRKSSRAGGVTG